MGYYINPTDGQSKKAWLNTHGAKTHEKEVRLIVDGIGISETVPVCLVDNGDFTAAGIAFSVEEARVFLRPDGRPKTWFLVPRDKLRPYCSVL